MAKCGSESIRAAMGIKHGDKYSVGGRERMGGPQPITFDGTKYVTVVRDPLARYVSAVHHLNRHYGVMWEFETWMAFNGNYPTYIMTNHLATAKASVQDPTKFHAIYYLHELDQFFADHNLGKPIHINKHRGDSMPVTDEVREFVKTRYKEDYEMLEQIKELRATGVLPQISDVPLVLT